MEQPVEVGYFSEDFDYQFSGSFVEYESDEVSYFISLNYPMRLNVSSLGSINVSSITLMTKAGEIIATSDGFPLENDSSPQIGETGVMPKLYCVYSF